MLWMQAVEMFTDLREFEKAKQYLTPGRGRGKDRGGGVVANESRELLSKQAEWARNSNNTQGGKGTVRLTILKLPGMD